MSDLVGNPEEWFSLVVAHVIMAHVSQVADYSHP